MFLEKKIKRIGLFDSGIGGLTVLKELLELSFDEYIYIGDTANMPYGQKTPEQIIEFSQNIADFLVSLQIDTLVIACHTSSAIALPNLQSRFENLQIIGTINETMLHVVQKTNNGRIGIMATQASINSHIHKKNLLKINKELEIFEQACPRLVPLIESPIQDAKEIQDALEEYLLSLMKQKVDTIILGCTHYPLLEKEIKKIVGDNISLISSEKIIAQELNKQVSSDQIKNKALKIYSTGDIEQFAQKAKIILEQDVTVEHLNLKNHI